MARFFDRTAGKCIEATQWFKNGDHPLDYVDPVVGDENGAGITMTCEDAKRMGWEGQFVRRFRRPDVHGSEKCRSCGYDMDSHGWIDKTDETVCPKSWVVTMNDGVFTVSEKHFQKYFQPAYEDDSSIIPPPPCPEPQPVLLAMTRNANQIKNLNAIVNDLSARLQNVMSQSPVCCGAEEKYVPSYDVPLANHIEEQTEHLRRVELVVINILNRLAI